MYIFFCNNYTHYEHFVISSFIIRIVHSTKMQDAILVLEFHIQPSNVKFNKDK